jgi:hypothetical protein
LDETKLSSGPARSALQLKLQGENRATAAVLVMTKTHATLLFVGAADEGSIAQPTDAGNHAR